MPQVMTVLESHVSQEKEPALTAAFKGAIGKLDPGIEQTFLARGSADPTLWRIITVWHDREALDAMRASGETPRGVLMFREAGAEPSLAVFSIQEHAAPAAYGK